MLSWEMCQTRKDSSLDQGRRQDPECTNEALLRGIKTGLLPMWPNMTVQLLTRESQLNATKSTDKKYNRETWQQQP